MKLYSTNKKVQNVSIQDAVLQGLATDGGLFMPQEIPSLSASFFKNLTDMTWQEIAFSVAQNLLGDDIEKNVLQAHEKDFNQTTFYGKDTSIATIIEASKRFPMMSEKQVVIVKEAQHLAGTIEQLTNYKHRAKNQKPSNSKGFRYLVLILSHKKPRK